MGDVRPIRPDVMPSAALPEPPELGDIEDRLVELVDETGQSPRVAGEIEAVKQRETGRWSIDSPVLAEWAMRKLFEASVRADEIDKQYTEFKRGLDEWYDRTQARHHASIAFFRNHLEDFGRGWVKTLKKSDRKSLPLPSGLVKTTTTKAKAVIVDADVILEWAAVNEPTLVHEETKRWVLVSEIRDYVDVIVDVDMAASEEAGTVITGTKVVHKMTGEVVPGLAVEAEHVDVSVVAGPP